MVVFNTGNYLDTNLNPGNSDITIGFPMPNNIPIPIFRSKQSFYPLLLHFR